MGFETSLFVQPVDENLLCSICHSVLDNAVVACEGSHVFCSSCLQNWQQQPSSNADRCPECREGMLKDPYLIRPLNGVIMALKVRCPAKETHEGPSGKRAHCGSDNAAATACTWKGTLESYLNVHSTKECLFMKTNCSKCKIDVVVGLRKHHATYECPNRMINCDLCNANLIFKKLDSHKRDFCPKFLVKCNYCGDAVVRKDYGDHMMKDCKRYVIDCPFKDHGCEHRSPREEMEQHVENTTLDHCQLLNTALSRIRDHEEVKFAWNIPVHKMKNLPTEKYIRSSAVRSGEFETWVQLDEGGSDEMRLTVCLEGQATFSDVSLARAIIYGCELEAEVDPGAPYRLRENPNVHCYPFHPKVANGGEALTLAYLLKAPHTDRDFRFSIRFKAERIVQCEKTTQTNV